MFDRSTGNGLKRPAMVLGGAISALLLGATLSFADNFPTNGFNERDEVTNWLCVTPGCDVLRQPGNQCICTKDNPWESKLSRLKLTCSKREKGRWVPCPVPPDYREKLW
ncbi:MULTISPECIES: hypothetical protein [unclassified Mesorhizobium]|uniref:hypothetical protein n=1 Tax=unclassified Mesorhizobium TaxID=325217 RepID=UPI001925BA2C|nr:MULTISPECIES: hypothetical protein [unclassified Mesorhizobium]